MTDKTIQAIGEELVEEVEEGRPCMECGRPTGITSNFPPTVTCKQCF